MTTLPSMGLVLPVRGAPGSGVWDDTVDADLGLLDAHDHTTGKGARVPTNGININADLTFGGSYAPTNLHRITFASIVALTENNKSLFVNTADNELYWRSNAGTNVKMTSGGALNVAAFTGGIGGDYASVGAAVAFDDSLDRYTFKQQSNLWARMASGEVRILETGSTESLYVGLAAPAALAGSFTITLPLAAPGSTSIVQLDSAGVLTASNTIINDVVMTANKSITVSGTGEYKHGDMTLTTSSVAGTVTSSWVINTTTMSMDSNGATTTGATDLIVHIPLKVGDRLKSLRYQLIGNGVADIVVTVSFLSAAMVKSSIGTVTTNNQGAAWAVVPVDVTDTTIVADSSVVIGFSANATGVSVGTITYTYDRP